MHFLFTYYPAVKRGLLLIAKSEQIEDALFKMVTEEHPRTTQALTYHLAENAQDEAEEMQYNAFGIEIKEIRKCNMIRIEYTDIRVAGGKAEIAMARANSCVR